MKKIVLFIFVLLTATSQAAVITSVASGNWNNASTWAGGVIPGPSDDVVINNASHTITLDVNASIVNLDVTNGTLVLPGNSLTITGDLTVGASGTLDFTGNAGGNADLILSGALQIDGSLTNMPSTSPYSIWRFSGTTTYLSTNPSPVDVNFEIITGDTLIVDKALTISGGIQVDGGVLTINTFNGVTCRNASLLNGAQVFHNGVVFEMNGVEAGGGSVAFRVSGSGNMIDNNGLLIFRGTTNQSILLANSDTLQIDNLQILDAHTVTLDATSSSPLNISNELQVDVLSTLVTNDMIRLVSLNDTTYGQIAYNAGIGTITGNLTVERSLKDPNITGWRQFGFPFLSGNLGDLVGLGTISSPSTAQINAYYWDATNRGDDTANGWAGVSNWNTALLNQAYAIYSRPGSPFAVSQNPISITGVVNTTDRTYNLVNTFDPDANAANSQGWNFIPNPFASNIASNILLADVVAFPLSYKAVHIYDANTQQYRAITGTGVINYNTNATALSPNAHHIPMFGGFWVKANTSGQSIDLQTSHCEINTLGYPSLKTQPGFDLLRVNVVDDADRTDNIVIYLADGVTDGLDNGYDAYKLISWVEEVPSLFIIDGNVEMSINALSKSKLDHHVSIGFEGYLDGMDYKMSIQADEFNPNSIIYLEDRKSNRFHDLRTGPYSFVYHQSDLKDRFVLHLNALSVGLQESQLRDIFVAQTDQGKILILPDNEVVDIEIYDLTGALLGQMKAYSQDRLDLTEFDKPGIQMMKVISGKESRILKF